MAQGFVLRSFLFRDAVVFPMVAARIAGPFVFLGRVIRCNYQRRGPTLKDDFLGMALGTADNKLARFFFLFWSRIVLRLVVPHCRPSPGQTYLHDLHADPIGEIRGHLVHARRFLWSHEKWNSQPIKNRLYLDGVAHAPYGAELNQFAVFLVRIRVVRRIGVGKIVTSRIAEFRRFVLEESWRRLKLRRLKLRWSRWLLVLYLSLQPALPDLVRKSLLRKRCQFGALRDEDEEFAVTHLPIALGDAQKFPRRIESVHSRQNDIPATAGFYGEGARATRKS